MPLLGGITSFLDKYILGYALGTASGPALRPFVQDLENEAWSLNPIRPPDAITLAMGVAQGQVDEAKAREWATETGFGDAQFTALIDIANVGTGTAYAFELWRRGVINEAGFRRNIKRLGLEQEWIDDLVKVKQVLLTPAELAVMVQRGVVPDPGLLPVGPPTAAGKVPPMPVAQIDTLVEAAGAGYDEERLAALTRIVGLPASPDLAARMVFRNIIDRIDFDRAISEGNTRNEWAPFLFEGFREILTSHDYVELRLRGWINDAEMYAGTALHGLTKANTDLRFKVLGRPLSFHQVFIGERRGGVYDGPTTAIDPHFLKSLQESNIRPEWYNLAWAQRYTYPSAFVLRALTQSGDLTQAETHTILLDIGWEPTLAEKVSTKWSGGTGTTSDPLLKSARTSLLTALRKAYVLGDEDVASAQALLTAEGVAPATQTELLATWDRERSITRKELTPAQLKKAFREGIVNPATGTPFTKDEVVAELVTRGFSTADATVFVET